MQVKIRVEENLPHCHAVFTEYGVLRKTRNGVFAVDTYLKGRLDGSRVFPLHHRTVEVYLPLHPGGGVYDTEPVAVVEDRGWPLGLTEASVQAIARLDNLLTIDSKVRGMQEDGCDAR